MKISVLGLIIIALVIGLAIGGMVSTAYSQYGLNRDREFYEYHEGRYPIGQDIETAKVNTAIALQKIATEGITLHVVDGR